MGANKPLSERLLHAALDYAAKGFFVFPLSANSKKPLRGSHGLKDATTDPESIATWWEKYPEANIGMDCGRSGVVLLDIDVKNGKDARPAVADKNLDGVPCVATPNGGFHYYFSAKGIPFQSGSDLYGFKGLDIKCEGGYAILPPSSVTPDEGGSAREYKLVSGDFNHVPPAPSWLVEWERNRQATHRTRDKIEAEPANDPEEADPALMERARSYLTKMPPAISGQDGHIATLRAATALVVGFKFSDADALSLLRDYNQRCVPPWGEGELKHKVKEARKNKLNRKWGWLLCHGLPLRNFNEVSREDRTGKPKTEYLPRDIDDICADIRTRLSGFPKRLGERLFYCDESANEVVTIDREASLGAWIRGAGNAILDFRGPRGGFASMSEVFERLRQTGEKFDAVARAPFYPPRARVFNLFGQLPEAKDGAPTFWKLLDFMSPASAEDRTLMAAFFLAPLFYSDGGYVERPGWGIDTIDAQESGKTSVVEVCAHIYDCTPIGLDFATLDLRQGDVKKRLVSETGRATRIVLFDNVTKPVRSSVLADLITAKAISERAAYGHGEESRPNDLTFCVTFNGGEFDTDAATRFYTLKVKEPRVRDGLWKRKVFAYIDTNRLQLYADMIGLLAGTWERALGEGTWERKKSRFQLFDSVVIAAACRNRDEFDRVDAYLARTMVNKNGDCEMAGEFENALVHRLGRCPSWRPDLPTVVFKTDIECFMANDPSLASMRRSVKDVRRWIHSGLLRRFARNGDGPGEFDRIATPQQKDEQWKGAALLFGIDLFGAKNPKGIVQVFRGLDSEGKVLGTYAMPRFGGNMSGPNSAS